MDSVPSRPGLSTAATTRTIFSVGGMTPCVTPVRVARRARQCNTATTDRKDETLPVNHGNARRSEAQANELGTLEAQAIEPGTNRQNQYK
jgi:hypothetical protein